jgi:hypothetical protein
VGKEIVSYIDVMEKTEGKKPPGSPSINGMILKRDERECHGLD